MQTFAHPFQAWPWLWRSIVLVLLPMLIFVSVTDTASAQDAEEETALTVQVLVEDVTTREREGIEGVTTTILDRNGTTTLAEATTDTTGTAVFDTLDLTEGDAFLIRLAGTLPDGTAIYQGGWDEDGYLAPYAPGTEARFLVIPDSGQAIPDYQQWDGGYQEEGAEAPDLGEAAPIDPSAIPDAPYTGDQLPDHLRPTQGEADAPADGETPEPAALEPTIAAAPVSRPPEAVEGREPLDVILRDSNGTPISGALVSVYEYDGNDVGQVVTDAEGRAQMLLPFAREGTDVMIAQVSGMLGDGAVLHHVGMDEQGIYFFTGRGPGDEARYLYLTAAEDGRVTPAADMWGDGEALVSVPGPQSPDNRMSLTPGDASDDVDDLTTDPTSIAESEAAWNPTPQAVERIPAPSSLDGDESDDRPEQAAASQGGLPAWVGYLLVVIVLGIAVVLAIFVGRMRKGGGV
jgi:hypothetical protein